MITIADLSTASQIEVQEMAPGAQEAFFKLINKEPKVCRWTISLNSRDIREAIENAGLMTKSINDRIEDLREAAQESL